MSVRPDRLLLQIEPPVDDRLGVLSGCAPVVRAGALVTLDGAAVERMADRWAGVSWPASTGLDALHFSDGTARTANWVLLLDALNFCFWVVPPQQRWRVEWHGTLLDGYAALAAALSRAVAEGMPLWDAAYLAQLGPADLGEMLRPAPGHPAIPLFAARLANAREVGRVLLTSYAGTFTQAIAAAAGDAVRLALLLGRDFPSFADVATWAGRPVPLLKRAQICVADVRAAFHGTGWGALRGMDHLTAFADYKLPQLLRAVGVLVYAPWLAERVDSARELTAGAPAEVEIRAATIWAVELLRRALARRGVHQWASAIDARLWTESQTTPGDARPYHRTRTICY